MNCLQANQTIAALQTNLTQAKQALVVCEGGTAAQPNCSPKMISSAESFIQSLESEITSLTKQCTPVASGKFFTGKF